jgi:hypothetical protein
MPGILWMALLLTSSILGAFGKRLFGAKFEGYSVYNSRRFKSLQTTLVHLNSRRDISSSCQVLRTTEIVTVLLIVTASVQFLRALIDMFSPNVGPVLLADLADTYCHIETIH